MTMIVHFAGDDVFIKLSRAGAQELVDTLAGETDRAEQLKNKTEVFQLYDDLFDHGFAPTYINGLILDLQAAVTEAEADAALVASLEAGHVQGAEASYG